MTARSHFLLHETRKKKLILETVQAWLYFDIVFALNQHIACGGTKFKPL